MMQVTSDLPPVLPQKRSYASSSGQQPGAHFDDSLEAGLERLMDEMDQNTIPNPPSRRAPVVILPKGHDKPIKQTMTNIFAKRANESGTSGDSGQAKQPKIDSTQDTAELETMTNAVPEEVKPPTSTDLVAVEPYTDMHRPTEVKTTLPSPPTAPTVVQETVHPEEVSTEVKTDDVKSSAPTVVQETVKTEEVPTEVKTEDVEPSPPTVAQETVKTEDAKPRSPTVVPETAPPEEVKGDTFSMSYKDIQPMKDTSEEKENPEEQQPTDKEPDDDDDVKPQTLTCTPKESTTPEFSKAEEVISQSQISPAPQDAKDVNDVQETTTGGPLLQASASVREQETQQTQEILATARSHENFNEFVEHEKAKADVEDDWSFGDTDPYEDLKAFNAYLKSIGKPELVLAGAEMETLQSVITFRLQQLEKDIENANPPNPLLLAVQRVLRHPLLFDFAVQEDPSYLVEWGTSFCCLKGDVGADLVDFNAYLTKSGLAPIDLRAALPDAFSADENEKHDADEKHEAQLQNNDNDTDNMNDVETKANDHESDDEFTDGETDLDFKYPLPPTVDHPTVKCVLRSATKAGWNSSVGGVVLCFCFFVLLSVSVFKSNFELMFE